MIVAAVTREWITTLVVWNLIVIGLGAIAWWWGQGDR